MARWRGIRRQFSRSREGSSEFEAYLAESYRSLYSGAYRFTGTHEDAEDLLQESVLRAFKGWDSFEKGTNFRAWMWRIMLNLHISRSRSAARLAQSSLDAVDQDLWQDPEHPTEGLDVTLLRGVLDPDLDAALNSLPESIRLVILMVDLQEMTYQEVADVLKIPLGTVRSRLFRGRNMMKERLSACAVRKGWESDV